MNKNILIALVVIVILGLGFVLVKNSSRNQTPATNTPATQTQSTTAPTSAMKESVSTSPSAMMEKEADVTLTANGFEPATVTIKKGEKVVWTNKSGEDATVNSDPHPTHTDYPPLNLNGFSNGGKLELVFDKPGRYGYHDHLRPELKGTVVVE